MLTSNQRDILAGTIVSSILDERWRKTDMGEIVTDLRSIILIYKHWRDVVEEIDIAMENEDGRDKNTDQLD